LSLILGLGLDLIAFHMLLREFTDHIYDPVSPLVFWGNPRLAKIDGVNAWQAGRAIMILLLKKRM
jgi:hypothetical protein